MYFVFSKIIGFFLDPFWWILGVFIAGAFRTYKQKKNSRKLWIVGSAMLLFFSNGGPIGLLQTLWTIESTDLEKIERAEVAIVLGGYAGYSDLNKDLDWHKPTDRLLYPLKWYKEGNVETILLTGGSANIFGSDKKEADLVADWLINFGVNSEHILIESNSRNTAENAQFSKKLLKDDQQGVLLVTSEIHGRRAHAVFNKAGIEHQLVLVDKQQPLKAKSLIGFSSENLTAWKYFLHEVFGYAVYYMRGNL